MSDQNIRLNALAHLTQQVKDRHPLLEANIHRTSFHNMWFEKDHYWQSLDALADHMLDPSELLRWCAKYRFPLGEDHRKIVGLIFAGNIPLVGFHDFLTVYLSGHQAEIKLSGKDPYVFPAVMQLLSEEDTALSDQVRMVDKLKNHEAVIATGSNNTNRYFKKYFEHFPSILRNNRTSVAILDGQESNEELQALSHDIFDYFGLGCRNVTKLYVPEDYEFGPLLVAMHPFKHYMNNTKYKNNYDFNLSVELLNRSDIISTDFVLLKNEPWSLFSPVGMIFYEEYFSIDELLSKLAGNRDNLQTIVGHHRVEGVSHSNFGTTQQPGMFDYPDGEDIGHFLLAI